MSQPLREFLSSDALVAIFGVVALICAILAFRVWRSPQSWHIDEDTKGIVFHGWLDIAIFACIGLACAIAAVLMLLA